MEDNNLSRQTDAAANHWSADFLIKGFFVVLPVFIVTLISEPGWSAPLFLFTMTLILGACLFLVGEDLKRDKASSEKTAATAPMPAEQAAAIAIAVVPTDDEALLAAVSNARESFDKKDFKQAAKTLVLEWNRSGQPETLEMAGRAAKGEPFWDVATKKLKSNPSQ